MMQRPKISFIIPMYNESEVFVKLIDRMNALVDKIEKPCEIILIDDGSSDRTAYLMEELAISNKGYKCIFLSRNFGHQRALTAGLDLSEGDLVMILDADLQDPPEQFHKFYEKISEGFDVVYGIRKRRKENLLKKIAYKMFYKILTKISNYPIPPDSGDFCLITRRVVKVIIKNREESLFIRGLRSWVGFRQIGVPYERQSREAGSSKYTLTMLFKLAYDGIFNFSVFPIKLLTIGGLFSIVSSVLYAIYTVGRKYLYGDVPTGFAAIVVMLALLSGLQMLCLGILGEYIQRIFFQVKKRPLYIIDRKIINGEITNE